VKRVLSLLFIVACTTTTPPPMQSQPRPNEPTPPPPPEPSPTPSTGSGEDHHHHPPPSPKPAGGAAIGETCGPDDACVAGAECVKYFGIAGPRGPQFKSCEIKCSGKGGTCPADRKCVTIADGPGSVCR